MIEYMPWEQKIWGKTRRVVLSWVYSQHELQVETGGYCSLHYHDRRINRFSVISGCVRVVWCYGWEVHEYCLSAGNSYTIRAKIPHQFQVLTEGVMLEEYLPDVGGTVRLEDIVRLSTGGKVSDSFLRDNPKSIILEDGTVWKNSR